MLASFQLAAYPRLGQPGEYHDLEWNGIWMTSQIELYLKV
jgi:hypothetical protein